MDVAHKKRTWVHITYEANGTIEIYFVTDRWHGTSYMGRHRRLIKIRRSSWPRMSCLLRVLSYSPSVRYTIYSWNGYSVNYEKRIL